MNTLSTIPLCPNLRSKFLDCTASCYFIYIYILPRLLDHGYFFGWGGLIPGEGPVERSPTIERQHSWASLLPALYLKHGKPEEVGDDIQGQATVIQVREGLLFMACYILKHGHQATSRKELYALQDMLNCQPQLLDLHPGDIMSVHLLI